MEQQLIKQMYQQAEDDLSKAREELYRPSHDVVKIAGCISARQALHNFLKCVYLLHKPKSNGQDADGLRLQELIDFSKTADERFSEIDFSCLQCSDEKIGQNECTHYCYDINHINSCAMLAEKTQKIVSNMIA